MCSGKADPEEDVDKMRDEDRDEDKEEDEDKDEETVEGGRGPDIDCDKDKERLCSKFRSQSCTRPKRHGIPIT